MQKWMEARNNRLTKYYFDLNEKNKRKEKRRSKKLKGFHLILLENFKIKKRKNSGGSFEVFLLFLDKLFLIWCYIEFNVFIMCVISCNRQNIFGNFYAILACLSILYTICYSVCHILIIKFSRTEIENYTMPCN